MADKPVNELDDLADQVADKFEAHRQSDGFKDVSLVIDNNDPTFSGYRASTNE